MTTPLFSNLTWDGKEVLITISKEGWSRETKHGLSVVRFEGLKMKTQETTEAIIIEVADGPVLFLAKSEIPGKSLDQLLKLLPTLTTNEKN